MISAVKSLFGFGPSIDYAQLVKEGAIVIDVRSAQEFKSSHIKGSKNIPLELILSKIKTLKNKNTPIIACCVSGRRSGIAKNILLSNGFVTVHNGGSWRRLNAKIHN